MERRSQLGKFKQQRALSGRFFEVGVADLFLKSRKKGGSFDERRAPSSAVQAQDPFAPASRELTTFTLVRWRSGYVPPGKAGSARALPSRIRCVLRHRRKRSQKLSGINCVAATIQLKGREPATFDCSVDRRFGNACSPCCAVWCVHARYQCVALKTCCYRSHAVVKARLSYAAEQRRKRCQIAVAYAANALLPRDTSGICSVRLPPQPR
jgi:hypothetical protein